MAPKGLSGHSVTYHGPTQTLYLFGGYDDTERRDELWALPLAALDDNSEIYIEPRWIKRTASDPNLLIHLCFS